MMFEVGEFVQETGVGEWLANEWSQVKGFESKSRCFIHNGGEYVERHDALGERRVAICTEMAAQIAHSRANDI
jgi:hypothetical protein